MRCSTLSAGIVTIALSVRKCPAEVNRPGCKPIGLSIMVRPKTGSAGPDGRTHPVMDLFPTKIQEFATCFVALQKKRHQADYDPEFVLTRYEVLTEITVAQNAIEMLNNSSDKDRTAFAVYTLLPKRKQ